VDGGESAEEEGEVVGNGDVVDEHDAAWLLEQNAWLMEELESKDGKWYMYIFIYIYIYIYLLLLLLLLLLLQL